MLLVYFPSSFLSQVILLGETGVGKTNLLVFYKHKIVNVNPKTTIAMDFCTQIVDADSKKIKAYFWDTGLYILIASISIYIHQQLLLLQSSVSFFVPKYQFPSLDAPPSPLWHCCLL